MTHALKVDDNQEDVIDALEGVGASVLRLQGLERGCPDLCVGFRNVDFLMEIKGEDGRVAKHQIDWHHHWHGRPVTIVRTVEEALIAIGAIK
jgi:hypothetical protein